MDSDAFLLLADGTVFRGKGFGAEGLVIGETVFTTGMNGYIETLTDPSYFGQIVTQTFPLIGNYGDIPSDYESARSALHGYIVRSWCEEPSNFRSIGNIDTFLKAQNVIGLCGIDTRRLTKILRQSGVMNGMIISGDSSEALEAKKALFDDKKKAELLEKIRSYKIENAVAAVSGSLEGLKFDCDDGGAAGVRSAAPTAESGACCVDTCGGDARGVAGKKVVLWDFGAKANIKRELLKRGLQVVIVPSSATAEKILAVKPNGIMLSNGPGDPAENTDIIEEIKKIIKQKIPIFGICLGHQLLALANGAKTEKLKYGHRGPNQPVKNLKTGRVYISSQNHGYAVQNQSLPNGAALSFINTNDGTCEGIAYKNFPGFSVQFHPEACAGPQDTSFLFDEFVELMDGGFDKLNHREN